jgi:hypothetical protein
MENFEIHDGVKYPVVFAVEEKGRGADLWTFSCEKCGKKHIHGAGPGHRVAHCDGWDNGYILRKVMED